MKYTVHFKSIQEINYWDTVPERLGYYRKRYIDQIKGYEESRLIKVLMGQRRSGKSVILKQIISLLLQQGVPAKNILYLNFEIHALRFIQNDVILAEIVTYYIETLKPKGKIYLFFDEIQEVDNWEKIVNSYCANDKREFDIYITGSNAHLLSTELSTYVTGRFVEIAIFPFSFQEYKDYLQLPQNRNSLITYLEDSGMPELFRLKENSQKTAYLMSLLDSILMNDIIKRYKIKNPKLLSLLFDFMVDNSGHLFSLQSIVRKLKSIGFSANLITVGNYIDYLEQTYLIHQVPRYDLRGKKILEGERKYYLNDVGFSNYLKSSFDNGINRKLENFVFQTLIQANCKVYVGKLYNLEIDFIAEFNRKILYVQVTYLLHSEEVIEREYGNLEKINDNWIKIVVSLDEVMFPDKSGIQHVSAWGLHDYIERFKFF